MLTYLLQKIDSLADGFSRLCDALIGAFFDKNSVRRAVLVLLFVAAAAGIYSLNRHTPLVADDYNYSFVWGSDRRVESVADIVFSQKQHYFQHGGRVLTHFLAQFFLMHDKALFNVCNSCVFVLLLFLLFRHSSGRQDKLSPAVLLTLIFSVFSFSPAFGSSFLWVDGACNYLWGPAVVFLYLLPYRLQFDKPQPEMKNPLVCALYGLAGIVAAWTLENLAVTCVALTCIAGMMFYVKWRRVYAWNVCSLVGCLVGAGALLLAPGNFARMKEGMSVHLVGNFVDITAFFFKSNTLLVPAAALLALWLCVDEEDRRELSMPTLFYVSGMLLSLYSMTISPVFPAHARVTPLFFCLAALGGLAGRLRFRSVKQRRIFAVLMFVVAASLGTDYRFAYKDVVAYDKRAKARIAYMLAEKSEGRLDVTVPHNHACTRWCAGWALSDIDEDPRFWTSAPVARYYGLRSVRARKELF